MNFVKFCSIVLLAVIAIGGWGRAASAAEPDPALAVAVAMNEQGQLWRLSVNAGMVQVATAAAVGQPYSKLMTLTDEPQRIAQGEARPRLAVAGNGDVYVAWTQLVSATHGVVWFARYADGAKRFSPASKVAGDNPASASALAALAVAPTGRIYLAWQTAPAPPQQGRVEQGTAPDDSGIHYAISDVGGHHFQPLRKLADSACAGMALATDDQGGAIALWHHQFQDGKHDYAIASMGTDTQPTIQRASFGASSAPDQACAAPALALGGVGAAHWGWHMAWLQTGAKPGLFYARMDDAAWVASPARRFSSVALQPGHPALVSQHAANGDEHIWLAWQEQKGNGSHIQLAYSEDGGRSWQAARVVATTAGASGVPQLLVQNGRVYLDWTTAAEGEQLLPMTALP